MALGIGGDMSRRLVVDLGSGSVKIGWCGGKVSKYSIPSCAGVVRKRQARYFGEDCYLAPDYICTRPYHNGLMSDLEMLREILDVSFGKRYMSVATNELSITITEPALTPASIRHQVSELLFEDFNFRNVAICSSQSVVPYGFWGKDWGQKDLCASEKNIMQITCCREVPENGSSMCPNSNPNASLESVRDPSFVSHLTENSPVPNCNLARNPCSLVVDVGFSCSFCVPFINYQAIDAASLRSDLGGMHANAYLKNLVGFRSTNLEKNELLVQHMKEEACYVSPDYIEELKGASATTSSPFIYNNGDSQLLYDYVLPDYSMPKSSILSYFHSHRHAPSAYFRSSIRTHISSSEDAMSFRGNDQGNAILSTQKNETTDATECQDKPSDGPWKDAAPRQAQQSVRLLTERIAVPEIFFHPQDVNSPECGIPELIYRGLCKAPLEMQPFLSSQIFLVGGSTKFPGFRERLSKELRAWLPTGWPINIYQHDDPEQSTWYGASLWSSDDSAYSQVCVSRDSFFETGRR